MNLARNLGELVQELSRRSGVSVTRRSIQRWRRDPRYKAIARKTFDLDLGRACEDLTRDCGIGANEGRSYGFDSHTRFQASCRADPQISRRASSSDALHKYRFGCRPLIPAVLLSVVL